MSDPLTQNGIHLNRLFGTVTATRLRPDLAQCRLIARNRWIDGGRSRSTLEASFGGEAGPTARQHPATADAEGPLMPLSETDRASPVELALHALASCLTATLVCHAAARGIDIHEVQCEAQGELDLNGFLGLTRSARTGCDALRITLRVAGDASEETLRELCELAQRRSPVFDMLSNPVPIALEVEACRTTEPLRQHPPLQLIAGTGPQLSADKVAATG